MFGSGDYFVFVYYLFIIAFRVSDEDFVRIDVLFIINMGIFWNKHTVVHSHYCVFSSIQLRSLCMIHRDTGWGVDK